MASRDVEEDVKCSICLNIYTNPVTLKCGHNFCRGCIKTDMDTKEGSRLDFSCPRCRKRFRRRPALHKNTDLSNIAEKVKSLAGQENRKCSEHDKILEYYCTEDGTCICVLCWLDGDHEEHEVEPLEKAYEKKEDTLRNDLQKLIAAREKTEKTVQDLHQRTKHTDKIKKKVAALFKDIRKHVDDLEKRVRSELSRHESTPDLFQKLELEKEELSKKIDHMEKLKTADPITLLQDQESYRPSREDTWLPDNETCGPDEFIISMMLQKGLSDMEKMRDSLFPVLPSTTITLDINTAGEKVEISEDQKSAKSTDETQKPPNPGNTVKNGQAVSTQQFSSGKHYWVVEGSTSGYWGVGVCYSSMRKDWGWIGNATECSNVLCGVKHNCQTNYLHHKSSSNRFLVYLDYEAGRLSFYEISDPLRLLHTFTDKFTEPLRVSLQVTKYNNEHGQITVLPKDAWCNPMLGPITSV
ncbi:E3 ubiquitin-protein ligase TRIM39-like [Rana temporaria]|uniref:E3 ubiquitin-protein ligase TRIM39-like n=1 Tax=Rana temporaria TaxID=8407 RepID=UPI001AAD3A2B|nr:E3 ubiquitin-protein ligase TRIM39-like [Rana temporaria]